MRKNLNLFSRSTFLNSSLLVVMSVHLRSYVVSLNLFKMFPLKVFLLYTVTLSSPGHGSDNRISTKNRTVNLDWPRPL